MFKLLLAFLRFLFPKPRNDEEEAEEPLIDPEELQALARRASEDQALLVYISYGGLLPYADPNEPEKLISRFFNLVGRWLKW